jgi:hypothetical protein
MEKMTMNKSTLIAFLLLVALSCRKKENNSFNQDNRNIKKDNIYFSARSVTDTINALVKINKFKQAHEFLDTLILKNKNNGYLYFERGYVKGHELEFKSAISDFTIAQNYNYSKLKCQKMIFFCEKMMTDGKSN